MAAMKPRTGDGPLEVVKEGRSIIMRVPLEGGGRLVVEITPNEIKELQEALASAVPDTAFAGRGEGKGRMDVGKALFFFRRALNVAVPAPAQQDSSAENNKNEERTPA